ncbi:hypothetical protein BJ742DRAFT_787644 [Cladochytrium replicatum]|nr:hypothetical protein BJ742DRAFT_787644 [Cladochytrium replicatum]
MSSNSTIVTSDNPPPKQKRRRNVFPVKACDQCYKRKLKCDAAEPICSRCARVQSPCTYVRKSKPELVRRQTSERSMEERLETIEQMLLPIISAQQQSGSSWSNSTRANSENAGVSSFDVSDDDDDEEFLDDDQDPNTVLSKRLNSLIKALEKISTVGAGMGSNGADRSKNRPEDVALEHLPPPPATNGDNSPIVVTNIDDHGGIDILPAHVVKELIRLALENAMWPSDFLQVDYVMEMFDKLPRMIMAAVAARSAHWFKDLTIPGPHGTTLMIPSTEIGRGFFEKAKGLINFEFPSVPMVIGLMSMAHYCMANAQFRAAWMYNGLAKRMGRLICFHIDPDEWEVKLGKPLTAQQKQIRRRAWWALILMDLPDGYEMVRDCQVLRPLPVRLTRTFHKDTHDVPPELVAQYPPDATAYAMDLILMLGKITAYGSWIHTSRMRGVSPPDEQVFRDLLQEQLSLYDAMPPWIKESLSAPVISDDIGSIDPPSYFAVFDHILYHGNIILLNRHRMSVALMNVDLEKHPDAMLRNESFAACYLAAGTITYILKNVLLVKDDLTAYRSVYIIMFSLCQSLFVNAMAMSLGIQVNDRTLYHTSNEAIQHHIRFMKTVSFRWQMMGKLAQSMEWLLENMAKQRNPTPSDFETNDQEKEEVDRKRAVGTLKYMNAVAIAGREGAISASVVNSLSSAPDRDVSDATEDLAAWFKRVFLISHDHYNTPNIPSQLTPNLGQAPSSGINQSSQQTTSITSTAPNFSNEVPGSFNINNAILPSHQQPGPAPPLFQNNQATQGYAVTNPPSSIMAGLFPFPTLEAPIAPSGIFHSDLNQILEGVGLNNVQMPFGAAQNVNGSQVNFPAATQSMSFMGNTGSPDLNWQWDDQNSMLGLLGGPSFEESSSLQAQMPQIDRATFELLYKSTFGNSHR